MNFYIKFNYYSAQIEIYEWTLSDRTLLHIIQLPLELKLPTRFSRNFISDDAKILSILTTSHVLYAKNHIIYSFDGTVYQ